MQFVLEKLAFSTLANLRKQNITLFALQAENSIFFEIRISFVSVFETFYANHFYILITIVLFFSDLLFNFCTLRHLSFVFLFVHLKFNLNFVLEPSTFLGWNSFRRKKSFHFYLLINLSRNQFGLRIPFNGIPLHWQSQTLWLPNHLINGSRLEEIRSNL